MMTAPPIDGLLKKPKRSATGDVYQGRFVCNDVQWTGEGADALVTFTATAEEIADAADGNLLWTDQDVQRGIQPGLPAPVARELSLASGYPDNSKYVFNADNADNIAEKLLANEQLFLNPLVWNLRPGAFTAYWNQKSKQLYIYTGKVYLPDSHHRHQAIVKAVRLWRESRTSHSRFAGTHQFKIELYFLEKENEGNYFFDKNQRPRPTAKSKAYDLTTLDDLSLLAKRTIDRSASLANNVNRVTDRLTAKNPQVVTLSTLREMMRTFAGREVIDGAELDGLASVAATFYDLLAEARPELGHLSPTARRVVRERLVVDAAVMMHGYAAVMRDFNDTIAEEGSCKATDTWRRKLIRLNVQRVYSFGAWSGDLFAKDNPLWQRVGVVGLRKRTRSLTVYNTGAARGTLGRVLRQLLSIEKAPRKLEFLARG